jgi:hypothetical protein
VQVEHDRRVQVAAAGAHDQALQRGQAHRGVDAAAAGDRGRAGPVAQVQGDQVELAGRAAQVLGRLAADVGMGGAVEAVAADAQLAGKVGGQGVAVGAGWHRLVEGGVEHGHLRGLGEAGHGDPDAEQVGRVVQRGQGGLVGDGLDGGVVDQGRGGEPVAAVDHPVADAGQVGDRPAGGLERLEEPVEAVGVVGHPFLDHQRVGVAGPVGQLRPGLPDPLDQPRGQHLLGVHLEQLVLDGRRPGVDHQHPTHR